MNKFVALFSCLFLGVFFQPTYAALDPCNFTNVTPSPALQGCLEAITHTAYPLLAGSSLVANNLGSYQYCMYDDSNYSTHLCVVDALVGGVFPLTQAMCVPELCTPDLVTDLWHIFHCMSHNIGPYMDHHFLPLWERTCGNTTKCMNEYKFARQMVVDYAVKIAAETSYIHIAPPVHCGNNEVTTYTAGSVAMITVCAVLIILALANFALEWREITGVHTEDDEHRMLLGTPDNLHSIQGSQSEYKPLWMRLLTQFSIRKNFDILFKKEAKRSLGSLDGMRTISMIWIIIGHTGDFQGPGFVGLDNLNLYLKSELFKRWTFQFVLAANLCVDTFFFLSGLLTFYVLARKYGKAPPRKTLPALLLRWLRLMPLLAFVIGFYALIANHFGSGPLWYRYALESDHCLDNAWSNLLFINNFYPSKYSDQCLPWSWYLANDMQFFAFALIVFVVFYRKSPLLCGTVMGAATLGSFLYTIIRSYVDNVSMSSSNMQDLIYDKPWSRFAPFGVGCLAALLFSERFNKSPPFDPHASSFKPFLLMLFSVAGLIVTIYVSTDYFDNGWSRSANAIYQGFSRTGWSVCLAILTTLCTYKVGGVVNWVLTRSFWEPLGKLTFGAYLVHPIIMRVCYYSLVEMMHFSEIEYGIYASGFALLAYLIGLILFVIVEQPAAGVVGVLFSGGH